jgi:hypothetical protein
MRNMHRRLVGHALSLETKYLRNLSYSVKKYRKRGKGEYIEEVHTFFFVILFVSTPPPPSLTHITAPLHISQITSLSIQSSELSPPHPLTRKRVLLPKRRRGSTKAPGQAFLA